MNTLIAKCARRADRVALVRQWRRRRRFPGIPIAPAANLEIEGTFTYGPGCSIGTGANVIIPAASRLQLGSRCYVGRYVELGPSGTIRIGDQTSLQDRCTLLGEVTIGRYCVFAPNVFISSGQHYFDIEPAWLICDQDRLVSEDAVRSQRHHAPVSIDDDVWLGINSVVMRGVTVGKGAVVGAGSVVLRDVAPYTVVAGAPARQVATRLEFRPPRKLTAADPAHHPYFYSGFDVSQAQLRRDAPRGGLVGRGEFVLCLDVPEPGSLQLCAASADASGCEVTIHGQRRRLGPEFSRLTFEWPALSRIAGRCSPDSAAIIIKEAWVQ